MLWTHLLKKILLNVSFLADVSYCYLEYKFLKKIGKGASAKVYKILKRENKKIYATKMIRIKDWEMSDLESEITLMTLC